MTFSIELSSMNSLSQERSFETRKMKSSSLKVTLPYSISSPFSNTDQPEILEAWSIANIFIFPPYLIPVLPKAPAPRSVSSKLSTKLKLALK